MSRDSVRKNRSQNTEEPLAIVGIGCRLPGNVSSPAEFWEFMCSGESGIVEIPKDRWNIDKFYDPTGKRPGAMVTKWAGFIEQPTDFDADFFGISPREAEAMDPQQRLLLLTAWEAFEDAGVPLLELRGSKTGVFVGVSVNDYGNIQRGRSYLDDIHAATGNAICITANRISHRLDLRGPSLATDTACSSSMVATHLACRSILDGESDMALACGVNLMLDPSIFVNFSSANMMSPAGRSRTFDAEANGYVRAEGASVAVLKRLSKALEDGDRIYAQIRATAVNQDGNTSTITVPSGEAQETMLRELCAKAGVAPRDVDFVEAHGTGTPVGDPIEAAAIGRVFGQCGRDDDGVYVGAVKSQIGHLESGAGTVGLIKAALCIHHGEIPPNAGFSQPNPNIPFEDLKIRLPLKRTAWPRHNRPRMAAVNSFGFGGTNASALLEEAPPLVQAPPADKQRRRWLLPISAASEAALKTVAGNLAAWIEDRGRKAPSLRDLAGTLALNRSHLPYRAAISAETKTQLLQRLRQLASEEAEAEASAKSAADVVTGQVTRTPKLMFVFTGQGGQWWAMARELLEKDPVFRSCVEKFDKAFGKISGWSILEEMTKPEAESNIHATRITQPAIFAVQIALVERLRAWGIVPEGVLGHSFGEVAAAYAIGALSLEDAALCIYHRGRLSEQTEGKGAIAAVGLSVVDARSLLATLGEDQVEVAAVNGANMVSLAGEKEALDRVLSHLEAGGEVFTRRIKMSYAPHTFMMEEIKEEFLSSAMTLKPRAGEIPMISTVTGTVIGGQALGADYWWRNIRHAVLFKNGVDQAARRGFNTFLEIGPHPTLAGLIGTCLAEGGKQGAVIATLSRKAKDRESLYRALGGLFVHGVHPDWTQLGEADYERIALPLYPWELKPYAHDAEQVSDKLHSSAVHPLLGYRVMAPNPTWENDISLRHFPYLEDHRLQAAPIFPGAGFLEMMFAAAQELFGEGVIELENVVLNEAMQVPEEEVELVQTVFEPKRSMLSIYSRTREGDPAWSLRATARLSVRDIPEPELPDWRKGEAYKNAIAKVRGAKFYDVFKDSALKYGPRFRGLSSVWAGQGEAGASIRLPKGLGEDFSRYFLHPVLGDAGLQLPFSLIVQYLLSRGKGISGGYLPVSYKRVRFFRRPGKRILAHSRMIEPSDKLMRIDIVYQDEKGRPVCEIEDGHFRHVDLRAKNSGEMDAGFYQEVWEPAEPLPRDPEAERRPRHWLVFTDGKAAVKELHAAVTALGHSWTEVRIGGAFAENDAVFTIDPRQRGDFDRLVSRLAERESLPSDILHFWSMAATSHREDPEAEDFLEAQRAGALSLIHLVQALNERDSWSPRLWVIGAGGQVVPEAFSAADAARAMPLAQVPSQGMARSLLSETARLKVSTIDLDRGRSKAARAALLRELLANGEELEVALRGGKRYLRRLEQREEAALPDKRVPAGEFGLETTYRVTMPAPGIIDTLRAVDAPRRAPGKGEVELRVQAVGLNFRDIMAASGLLPEEAEKGAAWDALGLECAGVVTRLGKGAKGLKLGDRVMTTGKGCLAGHFCVPAEIAFKLPASIGAEEAATIPSAFVTAYYALIAQARLKKGERVLIHLATGGVGLAAIQIAKMVGAEIFATAGSDKKRALLRRMGIKHVMNSRSLDFADEVRAATGGEGVDVVLNALAGPAIEKGLSCLRPFGRFLEIGKRDVYSDSTIGMRALARNISVFVIDMANIDAKHAPEVAEINRELLRLFAKKKIKPLPTCSYPVSRVAEAFKLMQRAEHIGKVVVTFDEEAPRVERDVRRPIRFNAKGGYLITGGLNGLGLEIAEWMAGQGAGALYLMGRSGASSEAARKAVARMRRKGTKVRVIRGDVSKLGDVEKAVARAKADKLPLRGVIHGAVVLDDAFIGQLDEARLMKVLTPKMAGAWNLHRAVPNETLDFFVCFSSIAALLGATGQANYVAANAFLDGLCRWRHAQGLPGLSIMWGVLGGTGVAQRNDALMSYMSSMGILPVEIPEALDGLGVLLRKEIDSAACLKIDWAKLAGTTPALRMMPRTKDLVTMLAGGQGGGGKIRAQVLAVAPGERPALLRGYLAEQIAKVLKVDAAKIDSDRQLNELGLDSLTSFELKNRIESELAIDLPVGKFLQRPSIDGLSEAILEHLELSLAKGEAVEDAAEESAGDAPVIDANGKWVWGLMRAHPEAEAVLRDCENTQALAVKPRLDTQRLRKAFDTLTQQHRMLRAAYPEEENGPGRLISDMHPTGLEVYDAEGMSETAFRELVAARASEISDIENGPLFRLMIFHRPGNSDVVVLKTHQLAGDGWSFLLILQKLLTLYVGLDGAEGLDSDQAAPSYDDFLLWQSKFISSAAGQEALRFWQQRLGGKPPRLTIPQTRTRKAQPPTKGGLTYFRIAGGLPADIDALSKKLGVTEFAVLLAAYAALLQGYSGNGEVLIHSASANRVRQEFEGIVGNLANMIAYRLTVSPDSNFHSLCKVAQKELGSVLAQQSYPLQEAIAQLAEQDEVYRAVRTRSDTQTALYQIGFSMRHPGNLGNDTFDAFINDATGEAKLDLGDLALTRFPVDRLSALYDLGLYVQEAKGVIYGEARYNADIYDAKTVEGILADYDALLRRLLARPESRLSRLLKGLKSEPALEPAE